MLIHHLDKAIKNLETLQKLTQEDIEDIKAGRHIAIFQRVPEKENCIKDFERMKTLIDQEIVKLAQMNPGCDLAGILDESAQERLAKMRENIEKLQKINRRYAQFVITIGEFYNTLFEEMLPMEEDGYAKKISKRPSLLEIRV